MTAASNSEARKRAAGIAASDPTAQDPTPTLGDAPGGRTGRPRDTRNADPKVRWRAAAPAERARVLRDGGNHG